MSDKLLLSFADKVNEIYHHFRGDKDSKPISAPRLVLVGTQSSGKTSLVNRLIGLDLLKVGENMVTRTPVNIRLHHTDTVDIVLTISMMNDGLMDEVFKISMQADNKAQRIEQFKKRMEECTDKITKNKWSISNVPLFVDVYSNLVTNFSFVDLPGQILTALTDKGQPENIDEEIMKLVKEQVSIPNTIVLTIIQSKTDLETDVGLAMIKKMQNAIKTFTTVGVITKPDLLDNFDNLNNIVAENISKSVMLDEGYFVVNNKTDSPQKETEWFMQNFNSKKEIITNKRFGIINLRNHLQKYLIQSIKRSFPVIKTDLMDILKSQKSRHQVIGTELKDMTSKMNYFTKINYQLDNAVTSCLESKGTLPNVGLKVKKIIEEFISEVIQLNPFDNEMTDDKYLNDILDSFNGYHITTQISMEQLIDRCITDKTKRPILLLLPISTKCIDNITGLLEETIGHIVRSDMVSGLESYPKLKLLVMTTLLTNIRKYGEAVVADVAKYLEKEEDFLWSTDPEFRKALGTQISPKCSEDSNTSQIRKLLIEYFKTIKTRAVDYIIKLTISGTIKKLERNVNGDLNHLFTTVDQKSISELFSEDPNIVKERSVVSSNIDRLEEMISSISSHDVALN